MTKQDKRTFALLRDMYLDVVHLDRLVFQIIDLQFGKEIFQLGLRSIIIKVSYFNFLKIAPTAYEVNLPLYASDAFSCLSYHAVVTGLHDRRLFQFQLDAPMTPNTG